MTSGDKKCRRKDCDQHHCPTCNLRHTEPTDPTCVYCLYETRKRLRELPGLNYLAHGIVTTLAAAEASGISENTSRNAEPPLPGGDALTLTGPGNAPSSINVEHVDNLDTDPPAVLPALVSWERDWRRRLGLPGATDEPTVTGITKWMRDRDHLDWAAKRHPDFAAFATEIRDLHTRLARVAAAHQTPETTYAECFDHAEPVVLIRPWIPATKTGTAKQAGGLADYAICPRCDRVYPPADLYRASLAYFRRLRARRHKAKIRAIGTVTATAYLTGEEPTLIVLSLPEECAAIAWENGVETEEAE